MRMSQYGHGKGTTQGGCSELSNISSKYLYPINSNITDEQGMDIFDTDSRTRTSTRTSHMYVEKGSTDDCFI